MQRADFVRLQHMLDAAREAVTFVSGKSRKNLDSDRMLVLSLVKEIEIIGEAASKVSIEIQQKFPQIPWADAIGMRHRLIHAYFDVDLDIVWETVSKDLPSLILEVEKILSNGSKD